MGEKVITGLLGLLSLLAFGIATKIPQHHVESPLGAGFWPKLILGILFLATGIHLLKLLLRKKEYARRLAREAEEARKREEDEIGEKEVLSLFIYGILTSFAYIYLVNYIGFIFATPIFMAIFMYINNYRNKVMLAVISLVTAAAFLCLFVKVSYIPLPRGYGIFRSISYLIY